MQQLNIMLFTIMRYLDRLDHGGIYYDDDCSTRSPTRSIVREDISFAEINDYDAAREEDEWEPISIPISIEEDYEIVIPPAEYTEPDYAVAQPIPENSGIFQRMREWRDQRSLQRTQLGRSISNTFAELSKEDPNQMEEEAIQRAMELSMLDFAIVQSHHPTDSHVKQKQQLTSPHEILGVAENASPTEIKNAYRKLARLHHPDKGGEAHRFEEIARAYRSLLASSVPSSILRKDVPDAARLTTATCDRELQDHRRLVNDLFQADGMDLEACVNKQLRALELLGLNFRDAGAINRNERNEIIHNSCFYLSLATSYLWGIGALTFQNVDNNHKGRANPNDMNEDELLVGETALQLKRAIEAAVVKAHPEWVLQGKVGEEVQAFSDFLVYTLDSHTLLSDWAIVVFDATSGFCDIYKGRNYKNQPGSMQSNTLTLRYIPGHYQPLVPSDAFARRPTLKDITMTLDDLGVFYVVTDGNS